MIGFSSQLGKAILGRTQLGNVALGGRVPPDTTTQTITGLARIQGTSTRTITGLARIAGTTTQTITGVASIAGTTAQTITGAYLIASEAPPRCPPLVVQKVVPSSYLLEICERKGT